MKKYALGFTASLKSAVLILFIFTFALATATLKQTKTIQAANTAVSQIATSLKAAVAPVASAAMMQNPVCSELPAPAVQRGTDITSSVGSLNDFVIGDFNNDGKKDVAVEVWVGGTSGSSSQLHTYLGNGSGGFTLAGTLATNFSRLVPASAADFNGDGRQDVLMYGNNGIGAGQQTINVITANANGVLGTTAQVFNYVNSDQYGRATLKTGDFNNDGRADFTLSITCCPDANYVYLSSPNGTHTRTTFNWGGSRVAIVGDINGDGNQDVVTSDNYYHAYTIRLGNGRGQFTNGQLLDYGVYLYFIGATDYNKDGRVDFVTYTGGNRAGLPDVNSNRIIVLTANSAGQITRFLTSIVPELNPPALTTPVATGDLTGDGNLDFVDGKTNAYLSNGTNGIYCASGQLVRGVTNSEVLEAADFNGDGKADLLRLGQRFDSKIEVWLSGTSGPTNTPPTITPATPLTLSQGLNATSSSTIATVSDAETPAGNLTVTATSVPAGISLTSITNVNGTIFARIVVDCNASIGQRQVELTVTDANGGSSKANLIINVTANKPPEIRGALPETVTIGLGLGYQSSDDVYVVDDNNPTAFPLDRPTVTASAGFTGNAFIFTTSGIAGSRRLRITDAGPVGTHTVTLTATDNCGLTTQKNIRVVVTGGDDSCRFPSLTKKQETDFLNAYSVATGDFTLDGKLDFAVSSETNNNVMIYRGDGVGGIAQAQAIDVSIAKVLLKMGDYNGDGKPDLFFSGMTSPNTFVTKILANQGNGIFQIVSTTLPPLGNAELGDFDRDGKTDVAVITVGQAVQALMNNGDGTFTPTPFFTGSGGAGTLLVVANEIAAGLVRNQNIGVWRWSGSSFVQSGGLSTGLSNPFLSGAGDFNKDGRPDIAYTTGTDDEAVVRPSSFALNTSSGGFYPGTFGSKGFAGDFNKDGVDDLILLNNSGSEFPGQFTLGDGKGGFCAAPKINSTITTGAPVAAADFDGDGGTDLVVFDKVINKISIWTHATTTPNTPPKLTLEPLTPNQGVTFTPFIGAASDAETPLNLLQVSASNVPAGISLTNLQVDNTGAVKANLQISCTMPLGTYQIPIKVTDSGGLSATSNLSLTVQANQPPFVGTYPATTVSTSSVQVTPIIAPGDDGGTPTVTVTAASYTGSLSIAANGVVTINNNNVAGSYVATVTAADNCGLRTSTSFTFTIPPVTTGCATPTFNAPVSYSANNRPYGLASGDFNGDGRIDLVTTNLWDNTITLLTNNGNGFTKGVPIAVGVLPNYVAARDLNGDNRLDLAVVNRGSDTVTILLGNGNGTFTKKGDYGVGNKSTGVMIGDFNVDGKLDLLLPNDGLGNVAVLNGNGDGSFQPLRFFFAGGSPQPGVVGDFNGDGRDDVAMPNYFAGSVIIMFGSPSGSLSSTAYAGNLGGPGVEAIAKGDLNGDGKLDLVITNTTTNQLFTILGDGTGGFTSGSTLATGSNYPASIVVTDFNSDGRVDIAVGGYSDNQVRVFKGLANGFDNQSPLVLSVGNESLSLLTNDFNGDGKPDLAIANQGSGTVSVLLNGCAK